MDRFNALGRGLQIMLVAGGLLTIAFVLVTTVVRNDGPDGQELRRAEDQALGAFTHRGDPRQ